MSSARTITLYPWFKGLQALSFWQAIWFLYFQDSLSAAEAILLYAVYDVGTTIMEVPSGYMSDRVGRRPTLILAMLAGASGTMMLAFGDSFTAFAFGQILLGAGSAFASGTDSALLYESLEAEDRQTEIEQHELKAWRFGFMALAVSAVTGGLLAQFSMPATFALSAVSFLGALTIALQFREPPHSRPGAGALPVARHLASLRQAFTKPVLIWLFALSTLMYVFSHIPFVFGQPIILQALSGLGLDGQTALVSGAVTSTMMLVSVIVSLAAPRLRMRLGLPTLLLLAFAIQIMLAALMAGVAHPIIIVALFMRMVPDSLSRPFIVARIQPELTEDSRATYLSLQSFCGRLMFAASLYLASQTTSASGQIEPAELTMVLTTYAMAGVAIWSVLALTARFAGVQK